MTAKKLKNGLLYYRNLGNYKQVKVLSEHNQWGQTRLIFLHLVSMESDSIDYFLI